MEITKNSLSSLENRMKNADWYYDYSDDYQVRAEGRESISKLKDDLQSLSATEEGKYIANNLWVKHAPAEMHMPEILSLPERKKIELTEKEINFLGNQFKVLGAEGHFTPELVDRLKDGLDKLTHFQELKNNGDDVSISYHLSKSKDSNLYFLNKYDMSVRRENHNSEVKQTFYVSGQDNVVLKEGEDKLKQVNRFTLKKAANYLAGRPVFNAFSDKQGNQYEAWARIDFKNIKPNGEHEMIKYRKEYPFDLTSALKKYSIKELATPEHAERLFESLKRGNLQTVTFVGENGQQEKLYASLQIGLVEGGSLNVFDVNKDKVPIQKLVENGYVGNDLVRQLKERNTLKESNDKQTIQQENKIIKQTQPKTTQRLK